ncbi:phage tail protein, partial [Lacticaseibacillus rhamnosus]
MNLLTGTSNTSHAVTVPKNTFKASNAKTVSVSSGETYTYSIEIPSNNTVDLEAAINLNSKGVFVRYV